MVALIQWVIVWLIDSQVVCSVLCRGPSGHSLNSSFANRNSGDYKRDLGLSVLSIAKSVPHGMLLFFPSYSAMQGIVEDWQKSTVGLNVVDGKSAQFGEGGQSLWQHMGAVKPIFQEPRGGGDFQKVRSVLFLCMCTLPFLLTGLSLLNLPFGESILKNLFDGHFGLSRGSMR
jgi:hypothetical protein